MVSSILPLLALAATAAALKVTSPSSDDVWSTGSKETITWDTVSSDQDTFNIYLSNMASYPSTTILLASDVSSSDGSYTIDGSALKEGNSFTINFTNGTETEQIYAQSNQFNITAGTAETTSSSSSASATATSSSASGTASSSTTLATSTTTASAPSSAAATASSTVTPSANSTKTGSASSTASATDSSSTAASTSDASSTASSSASASSTSTTTSGAGKVAAGWMAAAFAVAAMAL